MKNANALIISTPLHSFPITQPMRVPGHRMVSPEAHLVPSQPPLEHPYSALALVLALSGSERWATAPAAKAQNNQEGELEDLSVAGSESGEGPRDWLGGGLVGIEGESSRLWSTDSEGEGQGGKENEDIRSSADFRSPQPLSGSDSELEGAINSEGGTQEWLLAFESGGESESRHSACTDGEFPPLCCSPAVLTIWQMLRFPHFYMNITIFFRQLSSISSLDIYPLMPLQSRRRFCYRRKRSGSPP